MKGTETFKKTISDHLQSVADKDPLFAETLKKENKNIDGCINYILSEVQKSGCNGFADEEIFGMAMHYYDEDDIKPSNAVNAKVVVNHAVAKKTAEKPKGKKQQAPKIEKEEEDQVFLF